MGSGLRDNFPAPSPFPRSRVKPHLIQEGDRPDNLNHQLLKDFGCTKQKLPIESKSLDEKYFSSIKNIAPPPNFSQLSSGTEEEIGSRGQHYKEDFKIIFT